MTADITRPLLSVPPARSGWALAILCVAYVLSYIDRQALNILFEPIKNEFGVSDTQMALLQGLAFVTFYSLVGLWVGRLVDRHNRPLIVLVGFLVWSVATVACGFAPSFAWLFVARMVVGLGEASLAPSAYSLIADYFDNGSRGRAFAIFGAAGAAGSATALLIGGGLIDLLGNAPSIETPFGPATTWRVVFVLVGVPGLLLAWLTLCLPEPRRSEQRASTVTVLVPKLVLSPLMRRGLIRVFIIFSLLQLGGFGIAAWVISAYVRRFGLTIQSTSLPLGSIVLVGTVTGAYAFGWLGDRWTTGGTRDARLRAAVIGSALLVPVVSLWWTTDSLALSWVLASLYYFLITGTITSGPAILSEIVPSAHRGRISANYLLVTSVIGAAGGPLLIGLTTDYILRSPTGLSTALAVVPVVCILAATIIAWLGYDDHRRLVTALIGSEGVDAPSATLANLTSAA